MLGLGVRVSKRCRNGVETIVKFSQTTREEVGLGSELYLTLNTSSHATSQYRENH